MNEHTFSIGTDILCIDRIKALAADYSDPFFRKTFTERERAQAASRELPYLNFCTKFAMKEAVFKALCTGGEPVNLSEIEVLDDENGRPFAVLCEGVAEFAAKAGISQISVSASYDGNYAVASAICVREDANKNKKTQE